MGKISVSNEDKLNGSPKSGDMIARNPKNLGKAIYNVFVMRSIDNVMRRIKGQKWIDWKNNKAIEKTNL